MKKLLVMHPYLAPYRIDVYNQFNRDCTLEVLLYGSRSEKKTLGFDLQKVIQQAEFKYTQKETGWYLGRHLISSVYFKVIRRFRPDVILAHELGVDTLVSIFFKFFYKYKLFVTVDDSFQMSKYGYGRLRNSLRKFVVSHIDGYICVSQLTQKYLQSIFPKTDCQFLYFPIVQDDVALSEKINASSAIAEEYVQRYNLKGNKVILFVGRFEQVKRIDLLLDAYSECQSDNTQLVLVGSGSLDEKLRQKAEDLGLQEKVIFTGSLSGLDLYAWYYLAHLFVLPSNFEPFGAVVNESLIAGCRAIVSSVCGSSTLVSAENGTVFESENLGDLIGSMNREIRDLDLNKDHQSKMPQSFKTYYDSLVGSMEL